MDHDLVILLNLDSVNQYFLSILLHPDFSTCKDMLRARTPTDFLCVHSSSSHRYQAGTYRSCGAVISSQYRYTNCCTIQYRNFIFRSANVFSPFVIYFTERMAVRVFAIGIGKNIRLMHRIKTLSTSFSLYSSFTCLPREFSR